MKKRIDFKKLVNEYPYNYPVDVLFETLRWIIETGWECRSYGARWGDRGVFEELYGLSSTNGQMYYSRYGVRGERWERDLTMMFVRAVVYDLPYMRQWRLDQRVDTGRYRVLNLRVDDPGKSGAARKNVQYLLDSDRCAEKLTTQINSCCADATEILGVVLYSDGKEWVARLNYGVAMSSWNYELARQGSGFFGDFVLKARTRLEQLTANNGGAR